MKAYLLENQLTYNVRDFARQIWLAGLGAFARAQDEGGKFFETLVQEGQAVDARMRETADRKTESSEAGIMKGKAEEIREKATGAWNKLEKVFQARVARALCGLGVPIDLLSQNVQELVQASEAEAKARKVRAIRLPEPVTANKFAEPVV